MSDRRASRLALGFAYLGHTTMHVLAALYLTVVLGLEREWRIGYDELISLWTIGSLMIGLGAPLAGWLGDRWSECRMLLVFFLLTGAGSIAAGLADGPTALVIGLAVLGLGASIYHPVGMALVVRHAERRGRALGIQGLFGSVGVATAALIAGSLMDLISWRAAFIVPGIVALAIGAALGVALALGWVYDRRGDAAGPPLGVGRGDAIRAFLVLSVTMACGGMTYNALQTAMPKWFELDMGGLIGPDTALGVGGLVTLVYLGASCAQMVGGWVSDRVSPKLVYGLVLLVQAPLLLLADQLGGALLFVTVLLTVFAMNGLLPAESLLLARYTPDKHRGLAYGAKFIIAFGVGPLAVQLVAVTFGWSGNFSLMLWVLAALVLVAAATTVALPAPRRRAPSAAALVPAE